MDISINGENFKCNKKLAEKLKTAIFPKFSIGEEKFIINKTDIVKIYIIKVNITNNGVEYTISSDKESNVGKIVDENILFNTDQEAYEFYKTMCY